jgi:hypothetical protein
MFSIPVSNLILVRLLLASPRASKQSFEAQPRRIDRTFRTRVYKYIVKEGTKRAAEKWYNHWNPEVVATCTPDIVAVAYDIAHEPWTEVSGKVDCIAGLPSMDLN